MKTASGNKRLRAVLIENCKNLEKAIHYAYDVGKRMLSEEVEVVYHHQSPYGHIFVVGEKSLGDKQEKNVE